MDFEVCLEIQSQLTVRFILATEEYDYHLHLFFVGGLLPVFHQEMINYKLKPSYEYQEKPWRYYRMKKRRFTNLKQISK